MLALNLFLIANFLFKSLHSAESDIRKEYLLKRFKINSTGNWPVGQRDLFDTPLWSNSALETLNQASSHYDHFSPKASTSPEASLKQSEVPINPSQNLTAEDNGQESEHLEDDFDFEQDSERLKSDIDFELYFGSDSEQNLSPPGISDLIMAADKIQSINVVGKVYKSKPTTPRVKQRAAKTTSPRDKQHPRPDVVLLKNLRKDLENKFKTQHPKPSYSLRYYDVVNWPEGVNMFKSTWNMQEMEAIRSKMDDFVFVKRKVPYDLKTEYGINELGGLKDVLDHSMSKSSTNDFLLNRFREETGNLEARRIDWSLLDRRAIPPRYDDCVFNGISMTHCSTFYKNPEIVYNIHFSSKNENSKRNERESRVDDDRINKKPRNK